MADDQPTVFDRLTGAGLSQDRIEYHLTSGRVEMDGQVVTDPYTPAPKPARIVLVGL